jgi:pheromone shutdown protein TraB
MIILLGVGHVFDIADQVKGLIEHERPDVVCVELDRGRYQALLNPGGQHDARLSYRLLAKMQRRLASQYGGEAGAEMIAATRAAQAIGAAVLLIDTDASQMFARLNREMPMLEKVKLGFSTFSSLFVSRKRMEEEIESFQENGDAYFKQMEEQFPTLKRVLLDERNALMARRIDAAASRYPVVLAVIGDGHIDGILDLLERDDVKVYRLKDVRNGGQPSTPRQVQSNAQVNFHYECSVQ